MQKLLDSLSRVERMEITLGKEHRIWHLNLGKETSDILRKIGDGKLFNEKTGTK